MKIELKNIDYSAGLSEETNAYSGIVYIDGVKAFHVSNHGTGGGDNCHPVQGYKGPSFEDVAAWLAKNREPLSFGDGEGSVVWDLELECDKLLTDHLARKRLNRMVKGKICIIDQHKGADALFTMKAKPTPENVAAIRSRIEAGTMTGTMVNGDDAAFERALALV